MPELEPLKLSHQDLVDMDFGQKQDVLLIIAQRILDIKAEFIAVSGRYAEIKAELDALKQISSMLQSELKATQAAGKMG